MSEEDSTARIGTAAFALVFGLILIFFGSSRELFDDPSTRTFNIIVFAIGWLVAVVLFRLAARAKAEKK